MHHGLIQIESRYQCGIEAYPTYTELSPSLRTIAKEPIIIVLLRGAPILATCHSVAVIII